MTFVPTADFRNLTLQAAIDDLDGGNLRLLSAADVVLAIVDFDESDAFGAPVDGVATATGLPLAFVGEVGAGTGTLCTKGEVRTAGETVRGTTGA
jgi:hypothetical protein